MCFRLLDGEAVLLPPKLVSEPGFHMGLAKGAPKNRSGYICPGCGRKGLAANEMGKVWSAEGYVPGWCLECQAQAQRDYSASLEAGAALPPP